MIIFFGNRYSKSHYFRLYLAFQIRFYKTVNFFFFMLPSLTNFLCILCGQINVQKYLLKYNRLLFTQGVTTYKPFYIYNFKYLSNNNVMLIEFRSSQSQNCT